MHKILVLFTGGTIGSIKIKTDTINGVDQFQIMTRSEAKRRGYDYTSSQSLLIDKYKKKYNSRDIDFDICEIADVLSENMTIAKWNAITNILRDYCFDNYYGVIITHGTDTLGYFANYLAMILNNIDIPVLIVSSNYELEDQRANGLYNFQAACDFILNVMIPGVYVTYRNTLLNEKKTRVIYGSRLLQCSAPSNDFESINIRGNLPLGIVDDNGIFEVTDNELYHVLLSKDRFSSKRKSLINDFRTLNSRVLIVDPYVGIDYRSYNFKGVNAILHTLYHSGTTCVDTNMVNNNIINFARSIRRSSSNEIGIFAGPIYGRDDRDLYATSADILDAGIDIVMNTSRENAYVKLLLAYAIAYSQAIHSNQVLDFVRLFMCSEYNNEFIQGSKKLIKRK